MRKDITHLEGDGLQGEEDGFVIPTVYGFQKPRSFFWKLTGRLRHLIKS
jgi:hypothetical protein